MNERIHENLTSHIMPNSWHVYLGDKAGGNSGAGRSQHEPAEVFTVGIQFQTDRSINLHLHNSTCVLHEAPDNITTQLGQQILTINFAVNC